MDVRRFGKTNLQLSVFTLGTMRCLSSAEVFCQTLEFAIAKGINHIETARGYGNSERFLGEALHQSEVLQRSRLYLTSKFSPTLSAAAIAEAVENSLTRLQTDYLDCVALHGINTADHLAQVLQPEGALAGLQQAQSQGLVRHIGFSTHGDLSLILAAISTQQFSFVNLHYSYFFQRNLPAIHEAVAQDMGVLIISPADKGGQLYTPPEKLTQLCAPLSPLAFNYQFLLANSQITTLTVGPAHPEELVWPLASVLSPALPSSPDTSGSEGSCLSSAVGDNASDLSRPLSECLATLDQRLQAEMVVQLTQNHCHQCYACLPCPESIHIPEVLRLRNLAVAFDMEAYGQYRYGMFEQAGHWFPGRQGNRCTSCNECLPRCPVQLNIPKLLHDTHQRLTGSKRRRLWED